jgi:hypothetical protein
MITYKNQVGSDWKYSVTATFTHYKNMVKSLPPGVEYYSAANVGSTRIGNFTQMQPGQPVGEFYGYKVVGYFKDSADISKSPTQANASPGFFKYQDANHDGQITDADREYIGNPNPKLTYGLNLNVAYKNFDLSAFFYGVYGNDIFNYIKYWTAFPQVFEGNVSADILTNSWSPTNLNPKYPRLSQTAGFSNTTVVNSWYIEKGSYFRCKNLMLGYTLPKNLMKPLGIDNLRFYIQVQNLFTVTKYTGLDPELQGASFSDQTNFGIDLGNYPANQKIYAMGVNLNF